MIIQCKDWKIFTTGKIQNVPSQIVGEKNRIDENFYTKKNL